MQASYAINPLFSVAEKDKIWISHNQDYEDKLLTRGGAVFSGT